MKLATFIGLTAATIPAVLGQQTQWGQCGGIGWTGPTTCVAGLTCVYQNDWYYQCLLVTTSASASSTKTSSTSSTKTSSSSSSSKTSSTSSSSKTSSTSSSSKTSSTSTSKTSSAPVTSGTATVKTWFSFGDSYTQTGFTVDGTQPSVSNPFGNPAYPGYTACGSYPNWVDYVATVYNSSIIEVFNHAYGGATIDASLVTPYTSTVLSLVDQTNNFLNYDAPGKTYYSGWSSSNTLFSVWIGINDIGNSYYLSGDRGAFDDTLLTRYFQLVQELYNVGARHFLFLTVPPVDRSPFMVAQGTAATTAEAAVISDFNTKLASYAASFAASNSGSTTKVYDTAPIINAILNNPTAYGLVDSTSYGDVNVDAWCNNYHISPPVHKQVAIGVASLISGWI